MSDSEDEGPFSRSRGVLPVADTLPEDGCARDGAEYLALVRAEARGLPGLVSAPKSAESAERHINADSAGKKTADHPLLAHFALAATVLSADLDMALSTRPDLLPRLAWRRSFLKRFARDRNRVAAMRIAVAEGNLSLPETRLPGINDAAAWRAMLYRVQPAVTETATESIESEDVEVTEAVEVNEEIEGDVIAEEGEIEPDAVEESDTTPKPSSAPTEPSKSLLPLYLPPSSIFTLVSHHTRFLDHSFPDADLAAQQSKWLYSLLLHLDPDLVDSPQTSILRDLSRSAKSLRKRIGELEIGPEKEILAAGEWTAGLNMVITLVAGAFGQTDLADPLREDEKELEAQVAEPPKPQPEPPRAIPVFETVERTSEPGYAPPFQAPEHLRKKPKFERHWDDPGSSTAAYGRGQSGPARESVAYDDVDYG